MSRDNDSDWHEVLRDVTPLDAPRVIHPLVNPPKRVRKVHKPLLQPAPERLYQGDAHLEQFDENTIKRIKKGRMEIQRTLDLHDMNAEAAYDALHGFISECYACGLGLVLVITGKGRVSEQGVLRKNLPRWCEDAAFRPMIVGIQQAAQAHGGQGAYYVRLRRKR